MADPFRIRAARKADVAALGALEPRCFSDPWTPDAFREVLASPAVSALVAESADGAVTGYLIGWVAADEAEVLNLGVAPEWRRRGVGRALVREAVRRYRELGARQVFLDVRESNAAALRLYQDEGFVRIGRRRRYYRRPVEDALVLRAGLDSDAAFRA